MERRYRRPVLNARKEPRPAAQNTTLKNTLWAVLLAVAGFALLLFASHETYWDDRQTLQVFLQQAGGAIAVAGILSVLWELAGKRAMRRETFELAGLRHEVERSRLDRIVENYNELDWQSMLAATSTVDLWVSYGRTWRQANFSHLQQTLQDSSARLRVVMPDPDDLDALLLMAERFGRDPKDLTALMKEARADLEGLAERSKATVEIYLRTGEPLHALYLLGGKAVVTLYSHQRERGSTPALVASAGGHLHAFLRRDMDALISQGVKVYPPTGGRR